MTPAAVTRRVTIHSCIRPSAWSAGAMRGPAEAPVSWSWRRCSRESRSATGPRARAPSSAGCCAPTTTPSTTTAASASTAWPPTWSSRPATRRSLRGAPTTSSPGRCRGRDGRDAASCCARRCAPRTSTNWACRRCDASGASTTARTPSSRRSCASCSDWGCRPALARQLHALRLVQLDLPQAHRPRRDLDALVLADVLEGGVEGELLVGHEPHEDVGGRGADVREVLLLDGVDVEVLAARVLADDHALVDLLARADEQRPALLEVHQRELGGGAAAVGHQRAGGPGAQLAEPRLPAVEDRVHEPGAARLGEEPRAEADEAARGHGVVHPHPARAVVDHLLHPPLAQREQLGDDADVLLGHVDRHALDRLVDAAVDLARDDLRLADRELVALPAHQLDEDGELQLAAALHLPGVGALRRLHAE